jgi:hypothetical protein
MKKAKLMLLALALFSVLGATLAFKAKTSPYNWCYTIRELIADMPFTNDCTFFAEQKRTLVGPVAIYATSQVQGNFVIDATSCENPFIACVKVGPLLDN